MTAEVLTTPSAPASEEVVVVDVPEKTIEAEPTEEAVAAELQKELAASVSFKEETNVVGELPEAQKKALDELKKLVQDALNNRELTAPVVVKEEKAVAEAETDVESETKKPAPVDKEVAAVVEDAPAVEPKKAGFWGIPKVWGRQAPKEAVSALQEGETVVVEAPVTAAAEEKKDETVVESPVAASEETKEVTAVVSAEEAKKEEATAAVEKETVPAAAEKKKKKVSINFGIPKVNLSWGFPKKDKASVVIEEPKKEEEVAPVTETTPIEEAIVPVAEEMKEIATVVAPEVTAPAVEEPKEIATVVAPEVTTPEVTAPAVEELKDIEVISAPVEEPKEEVTAPEAETGGEAVVPEEETKDKEVISEVEEPIPAPIVPEEVSIWGVTLLADEKSDTVLLKFLRARDFKVKEAFAMLRNTVRWQKEFKIDALLEESLGTELDKVVYISGEDREGHPVCYNVYGEFQNKELYQSTFGEKPEKFLRWRVQFLEKTIRKDLEFSPNGVCTFVQVNDLKASPGPFKRELKVATDQALQILQDNYPEFVAKQVFINVPWYYLAFYKVVNPFFTQRTKSKFVFAGPSKSAETLFKYIAPEQVPVQYGGLKLEGEQEFTTADTVTEEIIKPATKSTIEFPCSEASTLVWEARVIGWDVLYGAEFVPTAEGGYTVIIQKLNKIASTDETVLFGNYKPAESGKVVLTFDNSASSKKKKLLYRSKTKPSE